MLSYLRAVSFVAGRLSDHYGPKVVVIVGGLLLGTGFICTGFIQSKAQLYLTYGLLAGAGAGMIYLPPVALAPRWWPDRRALATGIIVLGLGMGSFFMAPIATVIIKSLGWRYVFQYCGIAMGLMACISGCFLAPPPKGWSPPGWKNPALAVTGGQTRALYRDYSYEETIKTKQFWLLYLAYFAPLLLGCLSQGILPPLVRTAA